MIRGELSATVEVMADRRLNPTGLIVSAGNRLIVRAPGTWIDWGRPVDANGYEAPHLKRFTFFKRVRSAPWFSLCGAVGFRGEVKFHLGAAADVEVTTSGPLYLFANDAWAMYWNNEGAITAEITIRGAPR